MLLQTQRGSFVKSRANVFILVAVLVLVFLGIILFRTRSRSTERKREAEYQAVVATYSRDLRPGATREDVEEYIRRRGAQPERDQQPLPPITNDIVVRLGEDPSPWYCSRQVAYLLLKFDDADTYRGASLKPELQDCM